MERAYQQTVCSQRLLYEKIAALCESGAAISIYSGKICLTRYHSGAIIKAYGALAQLGVRHIRIVKVRGSILLCSTRNPPKFQENDGGLFYTISYIKTCDASLGRKNEIQNDKHHNLFCHNVSYYSISYISCRNYWYRKRVIPIAIFVGCSSNICSYAVK